MESVVRMHVQSIDREVVGSQAEWGKYFTQAEKFSISYRNWLIGILPDNNNNNNNKNNNNNNND